MKTEINFLDYPINTAHFDVVLLIDLHAPCRIGHLKKT